jgi:hypothetical protein
MGLSSKGVPSQRNLELGTNLRDIQNIAHYFSFKPSLKCHLKFSSDSAEFAASIGVSSYV